MRVLFLGVALAITVCTAAHADTPPDPRSPAELKAAADQGDIAAAARLGELYWTGQGVDLDAVEAVRLFRIAAVADHPIALEGLSAAYFSGRGTPRDLDQALVWGRKAAKKGAASARTRLVLIMLQRPEPPDAEAMKGLRSAADEGFLPGAATWGYCLVSGSGVPRDVPKGLEWLERAAARGEAEALRGLMIVFRDGIGVTADAEKARGYFERLADLDPGAAYDLGASYAVGASGFPKDPDKAMRYIRQAAQAGLLPAVVVLGERLIDGGLGTPNPALGADMLKRAADAGSVEGQTSYGMALVQGIGVPADVDAGLALLRKAADGGCSRAYDSLALLYASGRGVPRDPAKAVEFDEKAVGPEGGPAGTHGPAFVRLAEFYVTGFGTKADMARAEAVLRRGAAAGFAEPHRALGMLLAPRRESRADAVAAFRKAIALGDRLASAELGRLFILSPAAPAEGAEGVVLVRAAADAGDPAGLFYLGVLFDDGHPGLPLDRVKSVDLFERSAKLGDVRAAIRGAARLMANGSKDDEKRAATLLIAASASGAPAAQVELARAYLHGRGLERDVEKAKGLILEATNAGYPAAWIALGDLHLTPEAGSRDESAARAAYAKAASLGEPTGTCRLVTLGSMDAVPAGERPAARQACVDSAGSDADSATSAGVMLTTGFGGPVDLPAAKRLFEGAVASGSANGALRYAYAQLVGVFGPEAVPAGRELLTAVAGTGLPEALQQLGKAKILGIGGAKDVDAGRADLERASNAGLVDAMFDLGVLFSEGAAMSPDYASARTWFRKASDAGHVAAMIGLSDILLNHAEGPADEAEGITRLTTAAGLGNARAMDALARFHATGNHVDQDEPKALEWLEKGGAAGFPPSMAALGFVYLNGQLGQAVNLTLATSWFEKSAQYGDQDSLELLAFLFHDGQGLSKDLVRSFAYATLATGNVPVPRQAHFQQLMMALTVELSPEQSEAGKKLAAELKAAMRAFP